MQDLEPQLVEQIPRLRRYARALMLGDGLAADDLVQDCLERALSRLDTWRRGSNLRAWLFTIMHNIYVNQVRRNINGPKFIAMEGEHQVSCQDTTADGLLEMEELQQALAELPMDQREILLMVAVEGLKYREVASILGIPEGTVMSRLARARERLRKRMTGDNTEHLRRVK